MSASSSSIIPSFSFSRSSAPIQSLRETGAVTSLMAMSLGGSGASSPPVSEAQATLFAIESHQTELTRVQGELDQLNKEWFRLKDETGKYSLQQHSQMSSDAADLLKRTIAERKSATVAVSGKMKELMKTRSTLMDQIRAKQESLSKLEFDDDATESDEDIRPVVKRARTDGATKQNIKRASEPAFTDILNYLGSKQITCGCPSSHGNTTPSCESFNAKFTKSKIPRDLIARFLEVSKGDPQRRLKTLNRKLNKHFHIVVSRGGKKTKHIEKILQICRKNNLCGCVGVSCNKDASCAPFTYKELIKKVGEVRSNRFKDYIARFDRLPKSTRYEVLLEVNRELSLAASSASSAI
jgi:hypothetical protein